MNQVMHTNLGHQ
uniref:Uncharacterized protein n=1 Tax=Rhizophora mucronata TaxID=61149 RepID=A0A2P2PYG8_RHIMU